MLTNAQNDIKLRLEERLIEAGYKKFGLQWVKGAAIISFDVDGWQADYSDEIHNCGTYQQITIADFEEILAEFNELIADD